MTRGARLGVVPVLVAVAFGVLAGRATADETHVAARLLCTNHAALVQVSVIDTELPDFPDPPALLAADLTGAAEPPDFDCSLDGRPLRIKIGRDPYTASGPCAGAQRVFLSLWLDTRKLLSRQYFHDDCDPLRGLAAVYVQGETLLACAAPNTGDPAAASTGALACIDLSPLVRAAPPDPVEYPPDGSPRREGQMILADATEPDLCGEFYRRLTDDLPLVRTLDNSSEDSEDPAILWATGEGGPVALTRIDIDNDGLDDLLAFRDGSDGFGNDLVLVHDGRDPPGTPDLDPQAPGALDPLPPLIALNATWFGDGRAGPAASVIQQPFLWRGASHVLLTAPADRVSPQAAIYRLAPDHALSRICIFDRIAINY